MVYICKKNKKLISTAVMAQQQWQSAATAVPTVAVPPHFCAPPLLCATTPMPPVLCHRHRCKVGGGPGAKISVGAVA